MKFDIRVATANAIQRTQDPLAAIKLQEAYQHCSALGHMLTTMTDIKTVERVSNTLMHGFTDGELDSPSPAMAIALCALLCQELVLLGRSFADDPSLK